MTESLYQAMTTHPLGVGLLTIYLFVAWRSACRWVEHIPLLVFSWQRVGLRFLLTLTYPLMLYSVLFTDTDDTVKEVTPVFGWYFKRRRVRREKDLAREKFAKLIY